MAIAIRGTTPATAFTVSNPVSVTLTGTRQPQAGDLLIIIQFNDFYALTNMPTPTVGGSTSGVTSIVDADAGTNSAHIKSWYFVVGSTGDLTVSSTETGTADEDKGFAVYVLSGANTSTPIDASGQAVNTGNTTHNCPSISPTSSNAFLILHTNTGGGAAAASYTSPGGTTETYDSNGGTAVSAAGAILQLSASGATGTQTFTPNTSVPNNAQVSIAVATGNGGPEGRGQGHKLLPGRISPAKQVYLPTRIPAPTAVPGSVYLQPGATSVTVLSMAYDHYGVTTLDELAFKLDPQRRTMEAFCQGWWGRSFSECIYEILLLDRFTQFIRQSSLQESPTPGLPSYFLRYYGGDILDSVIVTQSGTQDQGRRFYTGGDNFIAGMGCIDLNTNKVLNPSLPLRNHLTNEFKDGETDSFGRLRLADGAGAGFRTMSGPDLSTWTQPNQVTWPGKIYWPIALSPSTEAIQIMYVFAWLVTTGSGGAIDHQVEDTHVLQVNIFGTTGAESQFNIGSNGIFYVDDVVEDTSFRYVYGREFVPGIGNFAGGGYYGNLDTDRFYKRVARIANATSMTATGHTGTVYTDYEWWTGTTWDHDIANAARLIDVGGSVISGLQGVGKLSTGNYYAVAQDGLEARKRVYYSQNPQGPWWHFTNVPCPPYGHDTISAGEGRHGDFCKLYFDFPAAANRVMTWCTDLAWNTGGGTFSKVGSHIVEADTPYPQSVPTAFGDHASPPPSNLGHLRHMVIR